MYRCIYICVCVCIYKYVCIYTAHLLVERTRPTNRWRYRKGTSVTPLTTRFALSFAAQCRVERAAAKEARPLRATAEIPEGGLRDALNHSFYTNGTSAASRCL